LIIQLQVPFINGDYVDNIPLILNGITCLCGSRKHKVYENKVKFSAHIKTKTHKKWLSFLNQNKANYYIETLKQQELIKSQQKIICNLQQQVQTKILTIDYLTQQLTKSNVNETQKQNKYENDLLDIFSIN
jgi:hypothetical protein